MYLYNFAVLFCVNEHIIINAQPLTSNPKTIHLLNIGYIINSHLS